MPVDWSKYPDDWPDIRRRILARAGGRCECLGECDLHSGRRCVEVNRTAAAHARGKIVLTVAHLDHDTSNNDESNLKAMCQRCHLRYDRDFHAKNAAARRAGLV